MIRIDLVLPARVRYLVTHLITLSHGKTSLFFDVSRTATILSLPWPNAMSGNPLQQPVEQQCEKVETCATPALAGGAMERSMIHQTTKPCLHRIWRL